MNVKRILALSAIFLGGPAFSQDMAKRIDAVQLVLSAHDLEALKNSIALTSALAKGIANSSATESSRNALVKSRNLQLSMQQAIVASAEKVVSAGPYMEAVLAMDRQKIVDRMTRDYKFQQYQLTSGAQYDRSPEVIVYREKNREKIEQMFAMLTKHLDKKIADAVLRHDIAIAIYYDKGRDVVHRANAFDYLHSAIGPLKSLY